ncbi:MAG: glycosyltransferase [Bacteroidota bacterium]|nr:glycosyltransferase [Bacteroidota bacterium]
MKKILFTIPNFDTAGSGKALLNLASGLNSKIFEPHIACLHDKGDFFQVVKKSGIPVYVFDYLSPARPIDKLLKNSWQVSRKLKKINPDLIHSFHYSADYTEAISARLAGIPWIFTKKNMSWGGSSKRAWTLRSSLAKGIIVQNTDMINLFYSHHKNIQLIPRGVDVQKFGSKEGDLTIREQMRTASDDRVIICVANFVPVKGIEILLQAFEALTQEFPNWKLWLVGDNENEYGRTLSKWVKVHNLEAKVRFSGKQAEVCGFLDHSEIFVLPTLDEGRREGSPVALLEAMANGKVVIGSAISGIKDQLKKYPNHLFKPGDWFSLAGKLKTFMNASVKSNKRLGQTFIELAENEFSIEKEILKHEAFYERMIYKSKS